MIQYVTAALLKSKVHAHDVFPYERLLRSNTNTNTILTINSQTWTSPWWHDAADRVPTVTMRGSISGGSVPSNQWPAPGTPSTLRSGDPALSRWWLRRDTYRLYLLFWVARGKVLCCDGGVCVWCHCAPVIKLITLPTPSPSSAHLSHHDTSSGLLIAAAENTENTETGAGAVILDTATGRQDTTRAVND